MTEKNILIAEDEVIVSLDIKKYLQKNNFKVVSTVASGEAFISQFFLIKPDLVIADLKLQGSLSGMDAIKVIRRTDKTPIVVVSGTLTSDLEELIYDFPNIKTLSKPFKDSDLLECVSDFFLSVPQ